MALPSERPPMPPDNQQSSASLPEPHVSLLRSTRERHGRPLWLTLFCSTYSLWQFWSFPHLVLTLQFPGDYPASTPDLAANQSGFMNQDASYTTAQDKTLDQAPPLHAEPPAIAIADTSLQEAPDASSGQQNQSVDPQVLQRSTEAPEIQHLRASVPASYANSNNSRFVEDLPESIYSKESRDDDQQNRVNSTVHVHEPVNMGQGDIPAALAAKAQALAMRQVSVRFFTVSFPCLILTCMLISLIHIQANSLPAEDPAKNKQNWDASGLERAVAEDERKRFHNAPNHNVLLAGVQPRPGPRELDSTQTLHDAPLSTPARQPYQPLEAQHEEPPYAHNQTDRLEPHQRQELAAVQLNSVPDSYIDQSGNDNTPVRAMEDHQPMQQQQQPQQQLAPQQDPREMHARELAMVTPATVSVSAAALDQLSRGGGSNDSNSQYRKSQHSSVYGAPQSHRQHQPVAMPGMAGSHQQQQPPQYAAPQNQHLRNGQQPVHSSPSQRKGPVLMAGAAGGAAAAGHASPNRRFSSPNESKLNRSASRGSMYSQASAQQQNYRDSVFASMSGVPDPTTAEYKPNQSLGQDRSLRSVFGAPIGMDDQRAAPRSSVHSPLRHAQTEPESSEDEDQVQPLKPAGPTRSKSTRTSRNYRDTNEPIQRSDSKLTRSRSTASRASRPVSVASSARSRRSTLPESWWSSAPEGAPRHNGPTAFQVEKVGMLPNSWWTKPKPEPVSSLSRSNSSRYFNDEDEEPSDTDSDGPAPSRIYSDAGRRSSTLKRRKSALPESYWSNKPKSEAQPTRSASRSSRARPKSRVAYANKTADEEESSSDEEVQQQAAPVRAPSRAASRRSNRSKLSKVQPAAEEDEDTEVEEAVTPQRSKSVRSTRESVVAGGRAPSRAASKLTRGSSKRTARSSRSRAMQEQEPTDDDEEYYQEAAADNNNMHSRSNSKRSVGTMGQPSTATGFSSVNTSRSRFANPVEYEHARYAPINPSYRSRPQSVVQRGEEPYTTA